MNFWFTIYFMPMNEVEWKQRLRIKFIPVGNKNWSLLQKKSECCDNADCSVRDNNRLKKIKSREGKRSVHHSIYLHYLSLSIHKLFTRVWIARRRAGAPILEKWAPTVHFSSIPLKKNMKLTWLKKSFQWELRDRLIQRECLPYMSIRIKPKIRKMNAH